jgi:hypothetical protein
MLTRMPVFPEEAARELVRHLVEVDRKDYAVHQPEFSEESWELGHRLVGTLGLS